MVCFLNDQYYFKYMTNWYLVCQSAGPVCFNFSSVKDIIQDMPQYTVCSLVARFNCHLACPFHYFVFFI